VNNIDVTKKHKNIEKYPFIIIVGKYSRTIYRKNEIIINVNNKLFIVGFIIL
jgi:hypothetical protein